MGKVLRTGQVLPSPRKRITPVKLYKGRKQRKCESSHTKLNPRKLPSKSEVINFVTSRTSKTAIPRLAKHAVLSQLFNFLVGTKIKPGVWIKAQCSPGSKKFFLKQFENLEKEHHRVKIKNKKSVEWRRIGKELFDLFTPPEVDEFVDTEFYQNQKFGERDLLISEELTSEFVELVEDQKEQEKKKIAKVKRESGELFKTVQMSEDEDDTGMNEANRAKVSRHLNLGNDDSRANCLDIDYEAPSSSDTFDSPSARTLRRCQGVKASHCQSCGQPLPLYKISKNTQTSGVNPWEQDPGLDKSSFNPWPKLNLKVPKKKKKYKSNRLFTPEVIEVIVNIHSVNKLGIRTAIDVFRKVARLFGQDYKLPKELRASKGLQLDPLQKRKKKACYSQASKKFKGKKFVTADKLADTDTESEDEATKDTNDNIIDDEEAEVFLLPLSHKSSLIDPEIHTGGDDVLPCPMEIRSSRQKISLFAEQGVAVELLHSSGGVLGADGTPLSRIGKTITTPITIGGKLRAIKNLVVANETHQNLVTALIHQCDRLGTLVGLDAKDIWSKVIAMVSDLASENAGLAQSVSEALGLAHVPGQSFCVVHTVLGFDQALKKVCLEVQSQIGLEKLLVNSSGSSIGTELETFDIASHAVDVINRLISPTFSNKPWSRYSQFTDYMEAKGEQNMAFALKDRRFGQLCATSAVSIHHWDNLRAFLSSEQSSARNVLACLVRSVLNSDVTKLLVLSNAIVGVQLEEPFLHMLISLNAQQEDLMKTLPKLFQQLSHPSGDPLQISKTCLPSLASSFLAAPYPQAIMDSLSDSIKNTDANLLSKYVGLALSKCGEVLERQRGPAYAIGKYANQDDDLYISKQVPDGVSVNVLPTHNLGPEHIFGDCRQRLDHSGQKEFNCMAEGLTIGHNEDLAFRGHDWKTASFNKLVKKLKEISSTFEKEQKNLRVEKSTGVEDQLESGRKVARLLDLLNRKHGGPISNSDQVDELLAREEYKNDTKKLKIALEKEISFAKTLFKDIPDKSPLFVQRKNSIEQLANNLKILYGKRNSDTIEADLTDLETALEVIENGGTGADVQLEAAPQQKLIIHQSAAVVSDTKLFFGTIVDTVGDKVEVEIMEPIEHAENLFIYSADSHTVTFNCAEVLPIVPVFSLNVFYSARISPVWELENYDVFKSLVLTK